MILISSNMTSSHLVCNLNFCSNNSTNRYFHFPSSSRQTKLSFLNFSNKYGVKRVMCSSGNDDQEQKAPTPKKSDMPEWKKWTVGIVLSIILPSFGHKMGPLMLIKSKVDMAIEKVEEVIEVAEEVAEAAKEVVEIVEEKLPENSKLREEVDVIKNLSEKAVEKSKEADEFLHQIEDIEDKIMESLNGPENNQAKQEPANKSVDRPVNA